MREKLMLDSIDAWIVQQPSLINRRNRALLPVVKERTQIADALARHLGMLGLERAKRPPMTLEQAVAEVIAARPKAPDGVLDSIEGQKSTQDRRRAADGPETQAAIEIAQQTRHSRDDADQESVETRF